MDEAKYVKPAKRVQTYNSYKESNGWLLEVFSDKDGWTENMRGQIYLTVVAPHNHKGFHVHAKAMYQFTCLRGKIKSIIYTTRDQKREIEMGEGDYKSIKVFPGEAHCMVNSSNEEAYMLTYRFPAWTSEDPDILTIAPAEINTPEAWEKIEYFKRVVKS